MSIQNLPDLGWNHYFQSQLDLDALESQLPFRVTAVQRGLLDCLGLDQAQQAKSIQVSTHLWRQEAPERQPAVGDWLMLSRELQPLYLLERKSLLKRRAAGREAALQLIAANIDTLFLVTSCNQEFSLNRIERYLALAAQSDILSVVVLTKIDLCTEPEPYLQAVAQAHPQVPVEMVNGTDLDSAQTLRNWIPRGQTVAMLGSSGVGKSTLINSLLDTSDQATQQIRAGDDKGRHTTTSRSLHPLPGGGLLIDNPGIRELQLVESEEGIRATFADIETLAAGCRFKNCGHSSEPGCAVMAAVEAGTLEPRRVANFHKLLAEDHRNKESVAQRRARERERGRFYRRSQKSGRHFKSRE